ncbi:MAG: hypothetical protein G01um101449_342, partial [Parcubacteria group bacterium Gr01-1014_49]
LYPWKAHDHYHAQVYASDIPLFYYGADGVVQSIVRIFKDHMYREELMAKQKGFLSRYSFDGQSSERVAKLLRDLAGKYRKRNVQ